MLDNSEEMQKITSILAGVSLSIGDIVSCLVLLAGSLLTEINQNEKYAKISLIIYVITLPTYLCFIYTLLT